MSVKKGLLCSSFLVVFCVSCSFLFGKELPSYLSWQQSVSDHHSTKPHIKNPDTLIFSGGGIKGLAYCGVLKALEEENVLGNIHSYVGTSAGAIFSTLSSIGVGNSEMRRLIEQTDFADFVDSNVPLLKILKHPIFIANPGYLFEIFLDENLHYGLCRGKEISHWLGKCFNDHGINENVTFAELHRLTQKNLYLIACSLDYQTTAMFDYIHTPDMPVLKAVRASMAIPFVFYPLSYNGDYFVDGGTTCNYPLWYFDKHKNRSLGFLLDSKDTVFNTKRKHVKNLIDAIISTSNLMINNAATVARQGNVYRTVFIDCKEISPLDFNLSEQNKVVLMDQGYLATKNYFEQESFNL